MSLPTTARPPCTLHSGNTPMYAKDPRHSPTYSLSEWHLLWKEESFPFFLAFSQNTEDQVHLGSVTHGRHRYHPTPHTLPVPREEPSLTGRKAQCDAVTQVLRHTSKLCLSKTGRAGLKPTGFYTLNFFIPHAQRN